MFILINLFLIITIVQYQNLLVNSANTNIGTCSCDLNKGLCDVSCCCDADCSLEDIKGFNCNSRSIVQSTCFKDLSIYKSNSPHVIQKKGDLVCVDHERDIDTKSINYEKMINQEVDASTLPRSINIDNSVSSPAGTTVNLILYQAGSSVFKYSTTTNAASYYSLPIKLFNSPACLGTQPITYLNDFTSTCIQPVSSTTCSGVLNPMNYADTLNLITKPSTLATSNINSTLCTVSGPPSPSTWTSPNCVGALETFTLTVYYLNPDGITRCSIDFNVTGSSASTVQQTFTVQFVKDGLTVTTTSRSGNPGYLQGAPIIAGNLNGNNISPSDFTILQASSTGDCSGTNSKLIRFGENVQSTCLFTQSTSCPDISQSSNVFMPFNAGNVYVAAYGSSNPSNITGDWLLVQFCTSQIGSSDEPVCSTSSSGLTTPTNQCYIRLDIQIIYANIGSVTNPQPVLGAIVYHYQRATKTSATQVLLTQTVTFQDISNAPTTEGDHIPRPNTRLPGDFFYPFSLNQATRSVTLSLVFNLFIIFLFIFM